MKLDYLLLLLCLLAGAALGLAMLEDPGYVLLSWHGYTLASSLWTAIVVASVAVTLLFLLLQGLLHLSHLPQWWSSWWGRRRQAGALDLLERGSDAFEVGQWARAESLLFKSARRLDRPFSAYLLAARAAAAHKAMDRAHHYLVLAGEGGHRLATGLARARLQLDAGDWEQAAGQLRHLHSEYGSQVEVIKLLLHTLAKLGRWGEIAELLPSLRHHARRQDGDAWVLERQAHEQVLAHIAASGTRINREYTEQRLREYFRALPRRLRDETGVVAAYAQALIDSDHDDLALTLLHERLQRQWQSEWVELFGRCRSNQPAAALAWAEDWLTAHPNDPILLRALARLCLQNRRFSEARAYFESSLQLHKQPETYAELIRLLVRLNDHQAHRYLIEGLQLMSGKLPDLPLP